MKRLILLIPFFALAACELAVNIDVPDGGPQLAINGLMAHDSSWRIDVSASRNILDKSFTFDSVTNAAITIADETAGTSTTLARQFYGRYRSSENPIPGHRYTIAVQAEGFEPITATTVAPDLVQIKNVYLDTTQIIRYKVPGRGQEDTYALTVIFDDPVGKNTYEIEVYSYDSVYRIKDGDTLKYVSREYAFTYINDPALVEKKDFFSTDNYPHRFDDESFEGKEKTLTILYPVYQVRFGGFRFGVRLCNQGTDYANFVDDRNLQRDVDGDPFAQPVPVRSNVSNRNGIFAIKTASVVEWDFHMK